MKARARCLTHNCDLGFAFDATQSQEAGQEAMQIEGSGRVYVTLLSDGTFEVDFNGDDWICPVLNRLWEERNVSSMTTAEYEEWATQNECHWDDTKPGWRLEILPEEPKEPTFTIYKISQHRTLVHCDQGGGNDVQWLHTGKWRWFGGECDTEEEAIELTKKGFAEFKKKG